MIIRGLPGDMWAYEIWSANGPLAPNIRNTISWKPKDPDRPEYLYLVSKVLGSHYADLSKDGVWQE